MQGISIWRNKLEELSTYLNDLADDLTLARSTNHLFQTNSNIKALVVDMYTQVVNFLQKALRYVLSGAHSMY